MQTTTTSPEAFYQWVLAAGILLSLAANVVALLRNGRAQKREVTFGEQFVTREVHGAVATNMDVRVTKIEGELKAIREEMNHQREMAEATAETRAVALHNRINDLGTSLTAQVAELRGTMNRMLEQLGRRS